MAKRIELDSGLLKAAVWSGIALIVAMIVAGILLAQAGGFPGFGKRALFFTLMGILPALRTDLSYWNWYAFPTVYTAAQFTVNIVGFCLAGLVLAKITATRPAALTKGHASA